MIAEVTKRKKYYQDFGKNKNVSLNKINILKHPEIPNVFFIYVNYHIGEGGIYKETQILETFDKKKGWQVLGEEMTKSEYGAFLGDLKPTEI
jgi:hypothetical protein